MRIVLMHGMDTNPSEKWYPWLSQQAQQNGWKFCAPTLSNANNPDIKDWKRALSDTNPDIKTVLIGHSRGGVAILRWLEEQPDGVTVSALILIATNSGLLAEMPSKDESNKGFYSDTGYNFEKIKQHSQHIILMHSTDDTWVPYQASVSNAKGLNGELHTFVDRGHFGKHVSDIPELITILNDLS